MATNPFGKEPTVAAIPEVRTSNALDVMRAVKEWIDVRQGKRGSPLDRAVTLRDLLNSGVAEPGSIRGLLPEQVEGLPLIPPGAEDGPIPPTPSNLIASGAYSTIILTWDFARGYTRHAYFEVWRSETNALGDAVMIAQVYEPIYSDDVGPGARFYYWVRAVSDAGHSSFNAVEGTLGETALNIEEVLDALEGAITEDFLHQSLAERIDTTELLTQQNDAAIKVESDARVDGDEALARTMTTLGARIGNAEVALQQEAVTRATADGGLFAQYTVKIDNGGYISGFGLASTSSAAGPTTSSFAVRADRFYIAAPALPSGQRESIPFIVQTTNTTLNGVAVPPGVYMRDAYMRNGSITNAKIGNLAVDDAKVSSMSVAKLTAGKLSVGAYIESTNYQSGRTGFIIHGNGNSEFSNTTVRGTVYATAGEIGGVRIESYGLRTTNYNGSNAGWRINSAGDVHFTNGTFRGHVTATSGTFSGALQAATGTFSGALQAATGTFSGQVKAGSFVTGAFTGHNWPPANQGGGVFLNSQGLLMGNANLGKFVQITSEGNMYTPGFTLLNGTMTIHAANIIDTLQLRGNAVAATVDISGPGSYFISTNAPSVLIVLVKATPSNFTTTASNDSPGGATVSAGSTTIAASQGIYTPVGTTGGDLDLSLFRVGSTVGFGRITFTNPGITLSVSYASAPRMTGVTAVAFLLKKTS